MPDTNPVGISLPPPPVIPDGDALYDQLMGPIEPELLTANLPRLKALYAADGTDAKRKIRGERYKKAFQAYRVALAEFDRMMQEKLNRYYAEALRTLEAYDRAKEEKAASFESRFATA